MPFPGDSAVLLPLLSDADELHLLLTRRDRSLPRHAGELSFPGGRIDGADKDAAAAALREAREEIGLSRAELLGYVATVPARFGGRVHAFAAAVRADALDASAWPNREVEAVLAVPLACLADPSARVTAPALAGLSTCAVEGLETRRVTFADGLARVLPYWRLQGGETLWGVSGEITARLLERLGWQRPPPARDVGSDGVRP